MHLINQLNVGWTVGDTGRPSPGAGQRRRSPAGGLSAALGCDATLKGHTETLEPTSFRIPIRLGFLAIEGSEQLTARPTKFR